MIWSVIGILLIAGYIFYELVYKPAQHPWKGEARSIEIDGRTISFQQNYHTPSKGDPLLQIGFVTRAAGTFELRVEGGRDVWAKRIGLSVESQTGDQVFDDLVYVLSDSAALQQLLSLDEDMRRSVTKLLSFDTQISVKQASIRTERGMVWVEWRLKDKIENEEATLPAVAREALVSLCGIEDKLPKTNAQSSRPDAVAVKGTLLVAVAGGFALNGVVQFFRTVYDDLPVMQGWFGWLGVSGLTALALLLVLGYITVWLLRGTSRAHIVLLEVLLVGGIGLFLSTAIVVRDININLDDSRVLTIDNRVIEKVYNRGGRRRSTSYKIVVSPWVGNEIRRGKYSIDVSEREFRRIGCGPIQIHTRAGALGFPWIESLSYKPLVETSKKSITC